MAITSKYERPVGESGGQPKPPSEQPPPFRATGQGAGVAYPDFRATHENANAVLVNAWADDAVKRTYLHKMYLFVEGFATGWQVAGDYGQSQGHRTFYPKYLSQKDFTVIGRMANQFEYDKLVEFVQFHQHRMLSATDEVVFTSTSNLVQSTQFIMGQGSVGSDTGAGGEGSHPNTTSGFSQIPNNKGAFRQSPNIFWDIAIVNIQAGHERFQFAPAFTLTCKVLNDHLQPDIFDTDLLLRLFNPFGVYANPQNLFSLGQIFGDLSSPAPKSANSHPINNPIGSNSGENSGGRDSSGGSTGGGGGKDPLPQ